MKIKELMKLDINMIEGIDVDDIEKARVKRQVLQNSKKQSKRVSLALTAVASVASLTIVTGFAFPTIATQIPFMENVIGYFQHEDKRYDNFSEYSTDIGLSQTYNESTVMIEDAVYDGTTITVSFAIETTSDLGDGTNLSFSNYFDVVGSTGSGGMAKITRISDTRFVGLSTLTPHFKDNQNPETIEISWEPEYFYNPISREEITGDWSFHFSLDRVLGKRQLLNETVQGKGVTLTIKSIEFTNVSTIVSYEQVVTDDLLSQWNEISSSFTIKDDLGNVYVDGESGPSVSEDSGKTVNGITDFGTVDGEASQLIIEPVAIASKMSGEGFEDLELEPIVIDLKR